MQRCSQLAESVKTNLIIMHRQLKLLFLISFFLFLNSIFYGQSDSSAIFSGTIKIKSPNNKSRAIINGDTIYYDFKVKYSAAKFSKLYYVTEIIKDTFSYDQYIHYDRKGRKRTEKIINVTKNRATSGAYQYMDYLEHVGEMTFYYRNGAIKKRGKYLNELQCAEFYFIFFQRPCRTGKWTYYTRSGKIKKNKDYGKFVPIE